MGAPKFFPQVHQNINYGVIGCDVSTNPTSVLSYYTILPRFCQLLFLLHRWIGSILLFLLHRWIGSILFFLLHSSFHRCRKIPRPRRPHCGQDGAQVSIWEDEAFGEKCKEEVYRQE